MTPREQDYLRFLKYCRHDPCTGCVCWIGGRTSGGGPGRIEYGAFWFAGRRWAAHRWSAKFIHKLEIEGLDVDHECSNPLCVHHLQAVLPSENWRLRWERELIVEDPLLLVPFYPEPDWYARLSRYAR